MLNNDRRKRPRLSLSTFPINQLPFELLSEIFILSSNPKLAVVCPQLQHVSENTKIQWLLYRHDNDTVEALLEGLKFRFFNTSLLEKFDQYHGSIIRLDKRMLPPQLFKYVDRHELAIKLLNRGASPQKPRGYPIIKAAQIGSLHMVKTLVSFGADATAKNNMALRVCAARENRDMVLYFLKDLGIKPDSETLKHCVQNNMWDMVKLLVEHGAVPDMSTINEIL
ncbi:hypothetical protein BJV82DRAFT_635054 [Fennellomyces sp. T-0311]|nr:hypothetical protein BJV82DRAFT_635054 [Fennellomyces sp. T-0311]